MNLVSPKLQLIFYRTSNFRIQFYTSHDHSHYCRQDIVCLEFEHKPRTDQALKLHPTVTIATIPQMSAGKFQRADEALWE
jgi:hypothetical protein